MSWAKVVQAEQEPAAPRPAPAPADARSVAVVDANAIIAGVQLHTLAEQLVTVPEVLAELRDVRTRQALEALPVRLHTREPLEDAVKAGASQPLPPLLRSAAYGDCCRACSSASRLSRSPLRQACRWAPTRQPLRAALAAGTACESVYWLWRGA